MEELKLKTSDSVISRHVDGEVVLLHLESEAYFGLDEAGVVFWTALESTGDFATAVDAVCEAFDVDQVTAESDLNELLEDLLNAGLVESLDAA